MATLLQSGAVEQLIEKLRGIRKQALATYPEQDNPEEEHPYAAMNEEYIEMQVRSPLWC